MSRTTAALRQIQPFLFVDAQAADSDEDTFYNYIPHKCNSVDALDRYTSALFNLHGMQVARG